MLKNLCKTLCIFSIFLLSIVVGSFVATETVFAQSAEDLGIGTVQVPPGSEAWVNKANSQGYNIGLIFFVSSMVKLLTVIMGVWVVFNIILAGYLFLQTSGDSSAYEKARTQITNSVVGLLLIVLAYTATGLVGFIFFGDAAIFLDPVI